ncbi:MAG: hypothetical protein HYX77_06715 [Acidobacteria bacterium]|nr:hypothetical protein [Acidobacteriota bacterium]
MAYQLLSRVFQGTMALNSGGWSMVQSLCTSGNHEALKCSVHGAAGAIAAVMAVDIVTSC